MGSSRFNILSFDNDLFHTCNKPGTSEQNHDGGEGNREEQLVQGPWGARVPLYFSEE